MECLDSLQRFNYPSRPRIFLFFSRIRDREDERILRNGKADYNRKGTNSQTIQNTIQYKYVHKTIRRYKIACKLLPRKHSQNYQNSLNQTALSFLRIQKFIDVLSSRIGIESVKNYLAFFIEICKIDNQFYSRL